VYAKYPCPPPHFPLCIPVKRILWKKTSRFFTPSSVAINILQALKSQSRAVMMSVCKVADNLGNGQSYGVIVDEEEAEGGLVE